MWQQPLFLPYFLLWCCSRLCSWPPTLLYLHYLSQYFDLFPFLDHHFYAWHSALFLVPFIQLWFKHFSPSKRTLLWCSWRFCSRPSTLLFYTTSVNTPISSLSLDHTFMQMTLSSFSQSIYSTLIQAFLTFKTNALQQISSWMTGTLSWPSRRILSACKYTVLYRIMNQAVGHFNRLHRKWSCQKYKRCLRIIATW